MCALCIAVTSPVPVAPEAAAFVRAPHRLVRISSEVVRLTQEAGRARQRYERGARAAKEQKRRAEHVTQLLRGQRFVSAVLHQDAGAVARAQYRTGGITVAVDDEGDVDPFALLERQSFEMGRRERLAWMMAATDSKSQALASDEETTVRAWHALDEDAEQLRTEKRAVDERLAEARDELNAAAGAAVESGKCAPVDLAEVDGAPGAQGDEAGRDGRTPADREAVSESGWTRPVLDYELTAGFGGHGSHWSGGHSGQDFAVPAGTPVRAVGDGTVVTAGCGGAFGISMVIRHDDGWYSQYAHLAAPFAEPGHRVHAGEWIGLSGTTGNSTGPHLHFEIRTTPEFGSAVEPVEWLRNRGVHL
ncbi:murein DD-endopeptidase MepM/ murein hydrolase activator NlpD [Streptomyces olivoverticillatus]|uniref:Murein DD-endopeptidase MepM/ murein hydrolase activator NlpD n=1 Tax=Streptomyces olivoverticillatus TaxID=66427 RepID=A0A7W7LQY1_9ACTN|nr:M23 family metallopeptidase [Streptomyces olivoverticillatus]MBB4894116.1 murein DD-endopeptidase MepM/ murein hydrolase activator NlpD [Streptomyces olivoverticillatus]